MSNTDYSFMKTGFQSIQGIEKLSNSERATLLSTIVVYFEEAIKIAEGIVVYEDRIEITGKDIVLALKVQALDHEDIWDKEETKTRVREGYTDIYNDLTIQSNLDGNYEDDNCDDDNCDSNTLMKQPKLDKLTYELIKSADERWLHWNPTEQINTILKSAIDKTEDRINGNDITD